MYIDIHTHRQNKETALQIRSMQVHELHKLSFLDFDWYCFGLHPWDVQPETVDAQLQELWAHTSDERMLAIGEVGLDKHVNANLELQTYAFNKQIEMAQQLSKPMVIHCVKAYNELMAIRKKSDMNLPWIIHGYNANWAIAEQLIDMNCYLSFGEMLFQPNSKAVECIASINPDRLFFETDDSRFSIEDIYEQAAKLLFIPTDILKAQIMDNFSSCFKAEK